MSDDTAKKVLWWVCFLIAPAILITIELFHPAGFTKYPPGMYGYLSKPEPYDPQFKALGYFGPQWWFTLHMIQTPMVGLVAVGLWLLVGKVTSSSGLAATIFAWLARVTTFVFFVYYTALDSIGGIGLSKTIEITEQAKLSTEQLAAVEQVLNQTWTNEWVGGVGSYISLTGSWAAFFSALFVAIALFLAKKAPWPALILLVGFGWELQVSHTMPYGPTAFGLLIISGFWIWWSERRAVSAPPTIA
jgi:hypothetical protein